MFKALLEKIVKPKKVADPSIKILIIEDTPVDAMIIKKAVDICGFTTLIATDGKSGVRMAIEDKPHLIVLDYHLPDMNGIEVLKKLQGIQTSFLDRIMILTHASDPDIVYDSFELGADQFFKKPIHAPFLAKQIKLMLKIPN